MESISKVVLFVAIAVAVLVSVANAGILGPLNDAGILDQLAALENQ